jgi:hypothetical protein
MVTGKSAAPVLAKDSLTKIDGFRVNLRNPLGHNLNIRA